MARTKQNQRSANRGTVPVGTTGGRTPPTKLTMLQLAASVVTAVWAASMLTVAGRVANAYIYTYAAFYMGVFTLVSLSITVMLGVVATDRMILSIRQRVLMQSAHRTTGVIAVAALIGHIVTKLTDSNNLITAIDVFVPFLRTSFIGLGTVAAYLMVSVLWTGLVRARFAGKGKPWMWRALHSTSYLAWPIAMVHGLNTGRGAATYVYVGYILCVLFVLLYLAVRFTVSLNRRKNFSSTATGALKPVGSLVPTSAPGGKSRVKRRSERSSDLSGEPLAARTVADRSNAPVAVVDAWIPAAGPVAPVSARPSAAPVSARPGPSVPVSARPFPGSAAPVSSRPYSGPASPVSSRPYSNPAAPVSSRPVSGPASPVSSRPYGSPASPVSSRPYGSPASPVSSRPYSGPAAPVSSRPYDGYGDARPARYPDVDETGDRGRRAADDRYDDEWYDAAPRPRSRTYAEDEEPLAARARRYADGERYDEVTRPISRRAVDEGIRRYASDEEPSAPRARRPTADERYDDDEPTVRSRRYSTDDEPITPRSRRDRAGGFDGRDEFVDDEPTRSRRYSTDDDVRPPRQRYAEEDNYEAPRGRTPRPPRYTDEEPPPPPRSRRDRSAEAPDAGRHSRSDAIEPADPWRAADDSGYLPPDDTPTLIDMATRRARRTTTDTSRSAGRGSRRKGRNDDAADDQYWRQLRGEAN